jgi:hypothetical protein
MKFLPPISGQILKNLIGFVPIGNQISIKLAAAVKLLTSTANNTGSNPDEGTDWLH